MVVISSRADQGAHRHGCTTRSDDDWPLAFGRRGFVLRRRWCFQSSRSRRVTELKRDEWTSLLHALVVCLVSSLTLSLAMLEPRALEPVPLHLATPSGASTLDMVALLGPWPWSFVDAWEIKP